MRILWLCNMIPGVVRANLGGSNDGGLWIDHVLDDLRWQDVTMLLLCLGAEGSGTLDERTSYALFTEPKPQVYSPSLEERFILWLRDFQPEVIHIWGTEYGHCLAMVNAAKKAGMAERVVISIQGLCGVYARHYCEGVPERVCRRSSLRDFLRQDNVRQQQEKFRLRGVLEYQALREASHVIGRTDWDRALTHQINPGIHYHFCNETLRTPFYQDSWSYEKARKHRIFASSCSYPVKGFHYLLEAFALVLEHFPDATLSVTGDSFFASDFKKGLRQENYFRYMERLCREKGLMEKIEFLGQLSAEGMKQAYLQSNVFALPSTIENSPNSLGEAMLLGVPCVAADVGGVSNLLHPGEGYVYQSTAPYMLAHYIMEVFRMEAEAEKMGALARQHAMKTHHPEENLKQLLDIYREIAGGGRVS